MANLTPELLARIQAYYAQPTSGSGWSPNMQTPFSEGGQVYQQDGGFIYNYDPTKQQAGQDRFNVYNQDGTFSNEGTFKTDDWQQTLLMALAAAGGMQFLPGGAFNAGGYGAGGLTEPVTSLEMGGGLPGGAGMDVAGFEGLTAADVGVGGMVPGGTGGLGTMAPLSTIEGPMSSSLLADSLAPVGGAAGAAKWLGPAATLLGGLSGAQGQKTEETSQRKTDPRVDPYLFGANGQPGLLQMTYDKLVGQMKPGGLQGYDEMQRVGMGLLNAPVAGNGFGLFTRGKY